MKKKEAYKPKCFTCGKRFVTTSERDKHAKVCAMYEQFGIRRL